MLYGLMSIFGNGVVSGWEVSQTESFAIEISSGYGNINLRAGRSNFPFPITSIPPSTISYVYVRQRTKGAFSEDVDFILDTSPDNSNPNFLLLAKITAGAANIESIDNSVRQKIGFLELIQAAIKLHKHRGGSLNPSKIDLSSEVQGQLPSFRIANFDAEKITTGTFDLSRMPILQHGDLSNVGLLTHPQLDTFVKTLETSNKELFGEIGSANLLQFIIAVKLIYEDHDSPLFIDKIVDERFINEFCIIPGITPDSFIDFDNTTAIVDLEQHKIKGISPLTGTSFYVNYDNALSWKSAFLMDNVIISGDSVTLSFNDSDEISIQNIETFESSTEPNQNLTDEGGIGLFKKQTLITVDNAKLLSNSNATNVFEGFYSGKFSHQQFIRSQYVKEFSEAQDWSTFDSFVMRVKCLDIVHGPVKLYFTSSSGEKSAEFIILDEDEITDNPDPLSQGFELRVIDLTAVPFRNNIQSFLLYTDDTRNPFSFFVDNITVQRAVLLPEQGMMKIRYSSSSNVVFSTIEWQSTELPGTEIEVRVRSSNGTAFLNRASFTPTLTSGDNINLSGTDLEIEVLFKPNSTRTIAPILHSIRLLILTEAEIDGFAIDTKGEFARGSASNVTITDVPSLTLGSPIYVDSFYFALSNAVEQIVQDNSNDTSSFRAELALFGNNSPIAPNQIFKTIEDGGNRTSTSKLFEPRSVYRSFDKSFVIADTYNDRILEFDEAGNLLKGVGSINYEHSGALPFPIAASFDIRTGILYIVWSKKVAFRTINVSKFTLQTTTKAVQLIKDYDKILGLTTAELESLGPEGQIMPIYLSAQNSGLAQQLPEMDTFIFIDNDAVLGGLEAESVIYKSILSGLGIPCYIGNYAYIDGIFTPTWSLKTNNNSYIICNATIAVKPYVFPSNVTETLTLNTNVSSIIEIDKNNNVIFGSNVMSFSPFFPGKILQISSSLWIIGGIRPGGVEGTPVESAPFNFRSLSSSKEARQIQKSTLKTILFGSGTPFIGSVIILNRNSNSITFQYLSAEGVVVSDVSLDTLGQYVVAESSLEKSGRIIKLDPAGNIIFSFGEGVFQIINSIQSQIDGSMMIST